MSNKSILVLDIETQPVVDSNLELLLQSKVQKLEESQREVKQTLYSWLHPIYAKVYAIGTLYSSGKGTPVKERVFTGSEVDILNKFNAYISQFKGVFVHFNGLKFDVPFILTRMAIHGIEPSNNLFCNLVMYRTYPHYDLMQVLSAWREFPISLREACYAFSIGDPKEILGKSDVTSFLTSCTEEDLIEYVMGDVRATYELYLKVSSTLS